MLRVTATLDSFQTSSFNVKTQSDCALVSRLLVLFFGNPEIMQSLIFLFGNRKTKMSSSEEGHPITSESDILQRVKTRRTRILIGVLAAVLVGQQWASVQLHSLEKVPEASPLCWLGM